MEGLLGFDDSAGQEYIVWVLGGREGGGGKWSAGGHSV